MVDLRPEGAGGKREALERLIERHRPGAVVVLGDDLSDADAFDAVHEAAAATRAPRIAPAPVVGVAVAVRWRLAAPPEVLERADVVLASSVAVGRFLGALARRLERETGVAGVRRGRR